jgi:hypothetical protein
MNYRIDDVEEIEFLYYGEEQTLHHSLRLWNRIRSN